MGVNFDLSAVVGLKTGLFKLEATSESVSSDRHEEDVGIESGNFPCLFVLNVNLDSLFFVVHTVLDAVVKQELYALFLEGLKELLRYFTI